MKIYYAINRECQTNEYNSLVKEIAQFDSLQEAMDVLYRQARRYGYLVTIDNSRDGKYGFCLWQIQVQVGRWCYFVTQETDESMIF